MDNNFNNLSLVQLVLKWKWHIVIITVLAALCGAIFSSSMFITPLYKSEAVAYPANISPYSDESETEQMLQIINSQSITDSIIEKYDLWSDYKIDKNYKFAKTYMLNEYHSKIKIGKTPYEAVSITVMDKDPFVACNIAKDILNFYDKKVHLLHTQKVGEVVAMYERQLREKQHNIDSLKQRYTEISTKYGITDISSQTREVTKSLLSGSAKATEMKDNLEQYGAEIHDLHTKIAAEGNTYVATKLDYEKELRFFHSQLTYSNIITEPFPSDKKAFPVRWVVVALSGLGAFLLSILVIFIIENRKRFVAENK
jgi:capsular polysaccharide biosynthesis protein